MKKSRMMMIAAAVLMTSCGSLSQLAVSSGDHKFQDGIYSNAPDFRSKKEKETGREETKALAEKTKESAVYLYGDRKDTILIPDNYSATIRFDKKPESSMTVTLWENPYDWRNNINLWAYYTPYSIGSSWWWNRHYGWHYPSYYVGWYDPWYYGSWFDPWYYGSWFDPWYTGIYWGWRYPWYPHYSGWYGGWYPHWGHAHHPGHMPGSVGKPGKDRYYGPRHETEGPTRVVNDRTTVRRGTGTSSSTGRGTIGSSSSNPRSSASGRNSTSYRRPSTTPQSTPSDRVGTTGSRSRETVSRPSGYDRNSSGSYDRGTSPSRSSGYGGGSPSSQSRSSSSGSRGSSGGGSRGSSYGGRR